MGTRTIKPLSNNAGQLGSSTKYWNKGYINELYINEIHTSSTSTLSALGISIKPSTGIVFEGATPDEFETQLLSSDPSADRVILLPDATGIIALTTDIGVTTLSGTTANGLTTYASAGTLDVEQYLTFENSGNISTLSLLSNEDTGDKFSIATTTHGATTISTVDDDTTLAHLTLDVHGDITLDAQGKNVYMARDGSNVFDFNVDTSSMKIMDTTDSGDYFKILTDTHGATTLSTVDDDSDAAHLTLDADGNIVLDAVCDHATTGIVLQNEGTQFGLFNIHHSASHFTLYENGGASTDDYGSFKVDANGKTTIFTWDAAGTDADIVLDAKGNVEINAEAGVIDFKDSSAQLAKISSDGLDFTDNINAKVIFEGGTDDTHQTALGVDEPTQDNTVSLPNASGTVQLQGSKAGQTFSVPLKNDDLYVLYVSVQNYWYHTGYAGQNFGTVIGSETDSVAMRAVSYVATANCKVNNVVVAFYSTQSADLEFQVTKIPLVDDSDSNVTLAAMTHNDINFSMAANYNYVKTMTMTGGGSDDNQLLKGQAFTLAIRRTDATGTRVLYGNCFAEIELI